MTPEEWKKGIQEWQQSGGREGSKAAPEAADDSGDSGWLGSAGSFVKGAAREAVGQLPDALGGSSEFAKGGDPNHSTAEWLGRETTDLAPSFAIDAFAPEAAFLPFAGRAARFANEALNAGWKGAIGGATVNPGNRRESAQTGGEIGAGSSVAGQIIGSRPVHRILLPAAIAAEVAQHGGMIPHGSLGGLYPWALAHGLSALAGLARAAGVHAPSKAGAIGSQVQQTIDNSQ